jgi:DNA-binding protein Fis
MDHAARRVMNNVTNVNDVSGVQASFVLPAGGVVLEELERELLRQALERTTGNRTHAARLLGLTRNQLRYRMRKFGLESAFAPRGSGYAGRANHADAADRSEPAWSR